MGRTMSKVVVAAGAAAAATYFFDPDRGRARRAKLKDQAAAFVRRGGEAVGRKARYEAGQARGIAHKVTHPIPSAPADDRALADRIRSEVFGRLPGHEHPTIDVVDGVVTLRGERPEDEIRDVEARVRKVTGVKEVVNYLHAPGSVAPNKAAARSPTSP